MSYELHYNECYACVSYVTEYDTFNIDTEIRNPEHGEFRSDFELKSRFYISEKFDNVYGGELRADSSNFGLRTLKAATKVLSSVYKKLDNISSKYGYTICI